MDADAFFLCCVLNKLLLLRGASLINPPSKITTKLTGQTNPTRLYTAGGVLTLCITGEVGVNPAPHTKNLVPHPDFSHGQGRPFVFTPLKRSAGTCFSTAHLPFSSSFLIREVHCGKSTQSPAVMQKVCGRHDSYLNPFELKNFSCASPASLLLHRKILFAQ